MKSTDAHVTAFLVRLGTLSAGNMSAADVRSKLEAYVPMLRQEFSAEVFCPDSLAYVAGQCKFFPAYGELCDHLRSWWRDNKPFVPALPAPAPEPRIPPTQEERDVIAALTRKAVAAIGETVVADAAEKPKITPAYLSDGRLLSECEAAIVKYADGKPGTPEGAFLDLAIMRRDGLRKKLGLVTIEHDERVEEMAE